MEIKKDQTIEGEITRIVEEAVFVDIGTTYDVVIPKVDVDRVKQNPSVDLEVGETIPVHIYYVPQNGGNPLGSIAQALGIPSNLTDSLVPDSDPWATIEKDYHVGDVVEGTVKNIKKYGAFVELPNGVDGLIHVSEMESDFTSSPWNVVNAGESVQVRIIRIEPQRKRIGLSLKDTME